jgi:hypothetical protein
MPWELRTCDNRDPVAGVIAMAARSVDLVITDPPYSPRVHAGSRRGSADDRVRELGFSPLAADERAAMAAAFARIARRWVIVFSDQQGAGPWERDLEAAGLEPVQTCVWVKLGCAPQFTGDRPACGHECIVVAHQTRRGKPMKKRWNAGGKHGVYVHAIERGEGRCHPTQKPLSLMRELVGDFSDPGELVCDPYAGSGTTGVACVQLGRRFLGWERDAAMAEAARRRLAGLRAVPVPGQIEMFA